MTDITIPPEALEAAVKAYFATKKDSYEGWVNDACLAMLKAWPGAKDSGLAMGKHSTRIYILPLPQENTNDHH